jgi:class 3 adenylate cyclase/pimeloyl-ACP methyl ester carboxylesterase
MADGAYIAYQVLGEGPLDLALMPVVAGAVELAWETPGFARVFRGLASFCRLIRFDQRGYGLSDPLSRSEEPPSLEERAEELLAVLDAVGSERAAVVANNVGGLLAVFFAATYPSRTSALVLDGCYARFVYADDYPWGAPRDAVERGIVYVARFPDRAAVELFEHCAPHAIRADPEFRSQVMRHHRQAYHLSYVKQAAEMSMLTDVRALLPSIQAPTLVLFRRDDRFHGKPDATYLAEHIPGAKLVGLPGEDNLMFVGDVDGVVSEISEFLTGARHPADTDRVLATVLFTDIVGSTERAAEVGDRRWRDLLDDHDRAIRRQLERFRGREVNTSGDGFVATFDGPGRAIECACAIRDAVRAVGVEVRVGLHTGEIELRGDDIGGIGVHIAARVMSHAVGGEVLASAAVPLLVAGSGIQFEDRGEHELKGVPGAWRLFAVAD